MPMKKTTAEPKNGAKRSPRKAKATRKPGSQPSTVSRLRAELQELKQENATLKKSLVALLHEDIVIDKEKMLKEAMTTPSLVELIAEMEARGV
jgi:hypothetical protein